MAKSVKLLLTENVDNLGIVGDVVNVRLGYARNFLLPRQLATVPTEGMIADLADKRKAAEAALAKLRGERQAAIKKIQGLEMTMARSCNDQGHLYGSVTQQDIATALTELGFVVKPREVRLAQTIKRIDTYDVLVKFDTDLEANVKLWVVADRKLDLDREEEMEFDNEGNLIEKRPSRKSAEAKPEAAKAEASKAQAEAAPAGAAQPDAEAKPRARQDTKAQPAKKAPKARPEDEFI